MSLWFAGTATLPALKAEFAIGDQLASMISSSVSLGFVCGTLLSALLGLADRLDPRRFFAGACLVAASANAATLAVDPTSLGMPALRFVVGVCMAGTYPVGMKMVSAWAKSDMGLLVGLLTGAVTLGSASAYLVDALGGLDWRLTITATSALAAAAGLLVNLVRLTPQAVGQVPFQAASLTRIWTQKSLRLANFGYFGHMWELFAVWAWLGLFLDASFARNPGGPEAPLYAKLVTFAAVAVGGLGCLAGGWVADRWGRTTLTMAAMATSGTCCLVVGLLFGGNPWLLTALCLGWGVAVVADSPQFSSCVIELSEAGLVGTMLTAQTCIGFLLSIVTIHLLPALVALVGWEGAFAVLALGPYLGVWAMGALRRQPDAARLAGGRK